MSGGARGVNAVAMRAAFGAAGAVIGVLPEGVERRLKEAATRSAVASGQAVIVSPYHPAAGFSAGAAMGRNKLIYGLADVAVIVSSDLGSGGTWTGAMEALTPLGRIGTVEDIATAAVWLLSPAGGWVTGKVVEVDGGTEKTNWPFE